MLNLYKFLFLFLLPFSALGQTGGIAGAVTDANTGRELTGVQVVVKPTGKTDVTDVEGRYLFTGLPPGFYTLEFKFPAYKNGININVRVFANEIAISNHALHDSSKTIDGILIIGQKAKSGNTAGVANERKTSSSILDGIASDVIKRTPDRNTADVLKRISGINVQDNKFPVVRGLNDRYNISLLNGVPMPSTIPDKKAFSFDLIPAALLDNVLVAKTATPDLPAEFAGAVIMMNTRDVPDNQTRTFSLGIAGFGNTMFKEVQWQSGTNFNDKLGFGGGARALPKGMGTSEAFANLTKQEKLNFSNQFENNWGLVKKNQLPALQAQFANSSRILLKGKETGVLFALSYSNIGKINTIQRTDFNSGAITRKSDETLYTDNVLWGAILNLSIKASKRSKISIRNIFSNNTNEENSFRVGENMEQSTNTNSYQMNYLQNYFYGTQLAGEHAYIRSSFKIKWNAGIQNVFRNTPNNRRLLYTQPTGGGFPFIAAIGPGKNLENGGMFYSTLKENIKFGTVNFIKSFYADRFKMDVKWGGFYQSKLRNFNSRIFTITEYDDDAGPLKLLTPDKIFAPNNFSITGFLVDEIYDKNYSYSGSSALGAGYLLFDNTIRSVVRIIVGARVENYNQTLKTYKEFSNGLIPINYKLNKTNVLPSISITSALTAKSNLRLAYSQTLARPDFRETYQYSYFDFVNYVSIIGNPKLTSTNIKNYDLRFETFPGEGQSFSIGAYYKHFDSAIEQTVDPVVANGNRKIGYINSDKATLFGIETEFRYNLKKLSQALKNYIVFGNFAYMRSEVNVLGRKRQMQGQAPYSANAGIFYTHRPSGTSFSIAYNIVGPRIFSVGTTNFPDFYENKRHIIDLQFGKTLSKRVDIKLNVADIFHQNVVLYQNTNSNLDLQKNTDKITNVMKVAPLYIVNVTYKLK